MTPDGKVMVENFVRVAEQRNNSQVFKKDYKL